MPKKMSVVSSAPPFFSGLFCSHIRDASPLKKESAKGKKNVT